MLVPYPIILFYPITAHWLVVKLYLFKEVSNAWKCTYIYLATQSKKVRNLKLMGGNTCSTCVFGLQMTPFAAENSPKQIPILPQFLLIKPHFLWIKSQFCWLNHHFRWLNHICLDYYCFIKSTCLLVNKTTILLIQPYILCRLNHNGVD